MSMLPFTLHGKITDPVVVFIHGFLGRQRDWNALIQKLPKNRCYITLDLPGHGLALFNNDKAYTFDETISMINRTLNHLDIESCELVGYSLGGRIGMNYTLRHPEKISRLFLISASPGLQTDQKKSERLGLDQQRAEKLTTMQLKDFLTEWYESPVFSSLKDHAKFDLMFSNRCLYNSAQHLAKAILGYSPAHMVNFWEKLEEIDCPVTYITGEKDPIYVDIGRRLKHRYPNIVFEVVPNAGHATHIENRYVTIQELTKPWEENQ